MKLKTTKAVEVNWLSVELANKNEKVDKNIDIEKVELIRSCMKEETMQPYFISNFIIINYD